MKPTWMPPPSLRPSILDVPSRIRFLTRPQLLCRIELPSNAGTFPGEPLPAA